MPVNDLVYILIWWMVLLVLTLVNYPLTALLFARFIDRGYIFAKILGILLLCYIVYILGILHIAPFTLTTIIGSLLFLVIINIVIIKSNASNGSVASNAGTFATFEIKNLRFAIIEEFLFLTILIFWSWVRAHQPTIEGLEKLMDYGFVKSILASRFFPPQDMWLSPVAPEKFGGPIPKMLQGFYINYYYFGHLVTAVLTRLSNIPSAVTYNLQIATLSALTFAGSFSLGINLFASSLKPRSLNVSKKILMAGILTAFLVTFSGNLHTMYAFTKGYATGDNQPSPPPPWTLELDTKLTDYWYPNATRFIPYTIHEFPSYSSIVADLHGHFSNIPFVLLMLAVLLNLLQRSEKLTIEKRARENSKWKHRTPFFAILKNFARAKFFKKSKSQEVLPDYQKLPTFHFPLLLIGFLLAVFYMTNSWDTLIYSLLTFAVLALIANYKLSIGNWGFFIKLAKSLFIVAVAFLIFAAPFNHFFHPFSSKIGVNCGYDALELLNVRRLLFSTSDVGSLNFGPFLFEPGNCQKTPLWMHIILWGFFYYIILGFAIFILWPTFRNKKWKVKFHNILKNFARAQNFKNSNKQISPTHIFLTLMISLSLFLLWIPEFFYIKDIYPAHFRANTMFKLGYQAFIMLSLVAGYTIVKVLRLSEPGASGQYRSQSLVFRLLSLFQREKGQTSNVKRYGQPQTGTEKLIPRLLYIALLIPQLLLITIYPFFGINSYYNRLNNYKGLYGLNWLKGRYPDDYNAVMWLDKQTETLCKSNASNGSVALKTCPVILEAVGDSYTVFARVSANTGLPTVIGWPVHEWLWRGSYDEAGKRKGEVETIYTSQNIHQVNNLLAKYGVEYIFVGELEREKYSNLNETVFRNLATLVYQSGETRIYKITNL